MKNQQDNKIVEYLNRVRRASVEDIAKEIYCSPSTVRRRLSSLSTQGIINRTHGGASINDTNTFVYDFSYRIDVNGGAKKRIALAAAKLINDGDVIYLDASTSAWHIIPYLVERKNVKVMTNGIDTMQMLSKYNIDAYSTGGKIDSVDKAVLVGSVAERTIKSMYYDICFFSSQSLSEDGIISDPSQEGNEITIVAKSSSKKTVFLCDKEKFGRTSTFKCLSVSELDLIITDEDLENKLKVDRLPQIICV